MTLFKKENAGSISPSVIGKNTDIITTVKEEDFVIVRLNDPNHLNEMSKEMSDKLTKTIQAISVDPDIKCVILTGVGEFAFCGGVGLDYLKSLTPETALEYVERGRNLTNALDRCRQPIIAAVYGKTIGPGFEIALACDMIIAAKDTIFRLPEVTMGIIPGWGGTQRLAHIAGSHRAKEIILLGKAISIETAEELDIVSTVVDNEELLNEARKKAREICKNDAHAVSAAKFAITRSIDVDASTSKSIEDMCFSSCFRNESSRKRLEDAYNTAYKTNQ